MSKIHLFSSSLLSMTVWAQSLAKADFGVDGRCFLNQMLRVMSHQATSPK